MIIKVESRSRMNECHFIRVMIKVEWMNVILLEWWLNVEWWEWMNVILLEWWLK